MKHKLIGKYVVVETNNNEDVFDLANAEVRGFFDSKQKADRLHEQFKRESRVDAKTGKLTLPKYWREMK